MSWGTIPSAPLSIVGAKIYAYWSQVASASLVVTMIEKSTILKKTGGSSVTTPATPNELQLLAEKNPNSAYSIKKRAEEQAARIVHTIDM